MNLHFKFRAWVFPRPVERHPVTLGFRSAARANDAGQGSQSDGGKLALASWFLSALILLVIAPLTAKAQTNLGVVPLAEPEACRLGSTQFQTNSSVELLAYVSEDELLVVPRVGKVVVWSARTGDVLRDFDRGDLIACDLSVDRQRLAVATRSEVRVWDVRRGRLLRECQTALQPLETGKLTNRV